MRCRHHRLVSVALGLTVLASLGLQAHPAHACTQPPGGFPNIPIEERARQADVVFVGTVIAQGAAFPPPDATVRVEAYLKSRGVATLTIGTFWGATLCQNTIAVGERWIFFAKGDAMSGQLRAQYLSAGDAITPADPATIAQLVAYLGQAPTPPVLPPDAPRACPQLTGRVPAAAIDAALANPDRVDGWKRRQNPNIPADPYMNPAAASLTLRNVGVPWHPLFNGLMYRTGCP